MSAATAARVATERLTSNPQSYPQKGSTKLYAGTIAMIDSDGYVKPGATATGCLAVGVVKHRDGSLPSWDNSSGADGALAAEVEEGVFGPFGNSGTSIAADDVGKPCFIVDDQTVVLTSSGTKSPAGYVSKVTSAGVYVDISLKNSRALARFAAVGELTALTDNSGGTANNTIADCNDAVTGVDGTGSNAASKADVDARLVTIANNFADLAAKVNAIIAALA